MISNVWLRHTYNGIENGNDRNAYGSVNSSGLLTFQAIGNAYGIHDYGLTDAYKIGDLMDYDFKIKT